MYYIRYRYSPQPKGAKASLGLIVFEEDLIGSGDAKTGDMYLSKYVQLVLRAVVPCS